MATKGDNLWAAHDSQSAREWTGNGHDHPDEGMDIMTGEVEHAFERIIDEIRACRKDIAEVDKRLALVEVRFKWVDIIAKSTIVATVGSLVAALMIKVAEAWHALNK